MAAVKTVPNGNSFDSRLEDEDVEMAAVLNGANILEVPLGDGGEAVTIDLDNELPEDPEEICTFLENEKCASEFWLAIGVSD
jgi:hypothetical protein